MNRVVITGLGSINGLGEGVGAYADGLRSGRSAIRPLTLFDPTGFRSRLAAEVADLAAPPWLSRSVRRHATRSDLLALIAAREAWQQADLPDPARARVGIVLGGTTGGMFESEECVRVAVQEPPLRNFLPLLSTPVPTTTQRIAQEFGFGGPRLSVATACSSGSNALGIAGDWIRSGRCDVVLCGGVDSLCKMTFSGFGALQALDPNPCRPFDRRRAGLTLGEGAGMLVVESERHAVARGATVLAEFLGYGVSADAHHITQPRADGLGAELALRRALSDSGVAPEEVDYVNAHGTATPLNDKVETQVLKAVLGGHAYRIPVSSTKSMIGHCLGAAGALEAVACVIALRDGFVPPTVGLEEADPDCDLDYVAQRAWPQQLRTVVSSSYGFGGNNTSVVLRGAE